MYKFVLMDQLGQDITTLTGVVSLTASRALNTVGSATVTFLDDLGIESLRYDNRIAIYRNDYLLGNTHWLIKKPTKIRNGWIANCKDTLSIPDDRQVAYARETIFSEKTVEFGTNGPADDLMKAFMRENLGSSATDTTRDLSSYLTIEQNLSLGQSVEKSASQQSIFSVMKSMADDSKNKGTDLYFDIIPSPSKLLFFVRSGHLGNNNQGIVFSRENNNLQEEQISWDYENEKTVIYVQGYGRGATQIIRKVSDTDRAMRSPFGIRETSINRTDIDVDSVLDSEGSIELSRLRAKQTLTGVVQENDNTVFGRDFNYGDLVTIAIDNISAPALFRAFSVSVDNGQENLDIRLEGTNLL
jgi:hypothetical protein